MDSPSSSSCNVSALVSQTQMDSGVFYLVKAVSHCVSLGLNAALSAPLLVAMARSPSLLAHTRFLLLAHLLCCDDLQLLVWTVEAVLLLSQRGFPVVQCIVFSAASGTLNLIELLLSTLLAVDRCVAVKCPLRYELLACTRRNGAVAAAVWALCALVGGAALGLALDAMRRVDAHLPRCRTFIFAPCLAPTSPLLLFCQVGTGVLLPSCYLTILGCFLMVCWDTRGAGAGARDTRGAGPLVAPDQADRRDSGSPGHPDGVLLYNITSDLSIQATQMVFYSIPLVMESYLIPGSLHGDALDLAAVLTYNLGISLIPLVYGYRSRELQRRLLQTAAAARCRKRNNRVVDDNGS